MTLGVFSYLDETSQVLWLELNEPTLCTLALLNEQELIEPSWSKETPPWGGFLFTMFPDQEPEGEDPPWRTNPKIEQFWGVALQGRSSSSQFLIREHSKKETPPGGGGSFDSSVVTCSEFV